MKNHSKNGETGEGTTDQVSPRMLRKKIAEKAAFDAWVKSDMKASNGAPQHGSEEFGPQVSDETPSTPKEAQSPDLPQPVAQKSVHWPTSEMEVDKIPDVSPQQSASEIHTEDLTTVHAGETSSSQSDNPPKSSSAEFALTPNANEKAIDQSQRARIVVGQKKSLVFQVQQDDNNLMMRGDLKKLMQQKLKGVAEQIKTLSEKALNLPKEQVSVNELLKAGLNSGQTQLGWEVSLPAVHLQHGKGEEFQKCVEMFAELLCKQEPWSKDYLKKHPDRSIEYIAASAARELRKKWGEHQLPDEVRVESPNFSRTIKLGSHVGPAPEPDSDSRVEDIDGAFRSVHPDLLHCHFAEDGQVQSQNLIIQVKQDQVEIIHSLATPRLQWCTAKVKKYLEDDVVVQTDLIEIHGEQGDLYYP